MVAKWQCIKFCAIFSGPLCNNAVIESTLLSVLWAYKQRKGKCWNNINCSGSNTKNNNINARQHDSHSWRADKPVIWNVTVGSAHVLILITITVCLPWPSEDASLYFPWLYPIPILSDTVIVVHINSFCYLLTAGFGFQGRCYSSQQWHVKWQSIPTVRPVHALSSCSRDRSA